MSEIRLNILTSPENYSGTIHGNFGDYLIAALTAEPETIEEFEIAVQRFLRRDSDWSYFRTFRKSEKFEPYDAGLLVIDLVGKVIMADTTYSYYSKEGSVRIKTEADETFSLPYRLSDDWKHTRGMPEFEGMSAVRREYFQKNPPFDARPILFGKPLFEFILAESRNTQNHEEENLFTEIHAKWLMTRRDDLRGKTPREVLLEKRDFISFELHTRSLQWSFTKQCPPSLSTDLNAYKFAGFGTHEIVIYYDLFRFLLEKCFAKQLTQVEQLELLANDWLNTPQGEFSGRIPAKIIENERLRINETMSVHECLIDEDCELCEMMAAQFDTPTFWGLDGSNMEYDRFEFSFEKDREVWEKEQREMEDFNREFNENWKSNDDDFFEQNQIIG